MISIIIPVYNNKSKLYKLLASIRDADKANIEAEVFVVDDCSSIDLETPIKNDFNFVRVLKLPKRSGPAYARNFGARNAKGDTLLFLDSDVIIKKDTLVKIEYTLRNENVSVLEGEYDVVPANPGFFPRYKALEYRSFVIDQEYLTTLGTRICAIRKKVFDELGGFNASYNNASVEDYELGYRLQDKGYKIHYDKSLEVGHHYTESVAKQFYLSFDRARLWSKLFVKRKKFDNFGSTLPEGIGRFSGILFMISLPFIVISSYFTVASIILFSAYLLLNKRFFILVSREEGMLFLLRAIMCHLLISVFINLGFAYGILTLRKKAKT